MALRNIGTHFTDAGAQACKFTKKFYKTIKSRII